MSTRANLLFPAVGHEVVETSSTERQASVQSATHVWDVGRFASEQLQRLVGQVFAPGWPKPSRHVVFSAIDQDADVAGICLHVGEILANQVDNRVGIIEATLENPEFENAFGVKGSTFAASRDSFASLRSASHQISNRLWLVPPTSFWGDQENLTTTSVEAAVGQVRHDFDYSILHVSPAGLSSEAAVLGHLCDGIVLVLEAHSTRRAAAQKVKETLQAANVRILGAVLSARTFPIPEKIYRRI